MSDKYVLRDRTPVKVDDLMEWASAFEHKNRIVAQTQVGDVKVSTVFLGTDHQWGNGPPLLFETMIFGGDHDEYQERFSTWEEAEAGHAAALALVQASSEAAK